MQSPIADNERTVNWYPEIVESGMGKNVAYLCPTPGKVLYAYLEDGVPVRGLHFVNDRLFAVMGQGFYEVMGGVGVPVLWTLTLRGNVADDDNPVSMASNGLQIMIVSATHGYIFTLGGNTFATIGGDFPGAVMCGMTDNYFLAVEPNSRNVYISAILDGTSWNALDYGAKEGDPGNVISLLVDHGEVWLFGNQKIEGWWDSGNPDFPFERIPSARIEQGCAAPWSPTRIDNSILWIGGDERGQGIVWRAQGYTPIRVSTHAVEHAIQGYGTMADAVAFAYQERGHSFYCMNFPSANTTWVLDLATGIWCERAYWNTTYGRYFRDRAQYHCMAWGKHIVGDWENGALYEQSIDYLDMASHMIRRLRRPPGLYNENKRLFMKRFEVKLEAGLGSSAGTSIITDSGVTIASQGTDPKMIMRYSWDGGKSFSTEQEASAGKIGEYKARAVWNRLGSGRDFVPEIIVTDPINWRIIDAYYQAEAGMS